MLSPRRRVTRRLVGTALLAASALTAAQLVDIPPASAAALGVSVNTTSVGQPVDYFTTVWGDRMDFSNAEDFDTSPGYMVQQAPNGGAELSGGRLQVHGSGQIFFVLAIPGSIAVSGSHDARSRPLDADRFRRITMRLHSDRAAAAAFGFRTCGDCPDGHKYFNLQPGWHNYDLDMTGSADLEDVPGGAPPVDGSAWSGQISMLWLAPAFNVADKPTLTFDDFAIIEPPGSVTVQLSNGSGPTQLWMDSDGDDSNNGPIGVGVNDGASYLGTFPANSAVTVGVGALNHGSPTQFLAVQGGTARSAWVVSDPTKVPRPRLLTPNESSGGDFATEVRGDPWDMDQPSDIGQTFNAGIAFSGGQLRGTGVGHLNDPVVLLNLGSRGIDAVRYHKFQITITYDGPWGLQDGPGGGLMGRVIWQSADRQPEQQSFPIVMATGRHTYVVDLRTDPAWAVVEKDSTVPRVGWGVGGNQIIGMLRFDPHEDPGGRSWQIDDVRLLSDEIAAPGYGITFVDDAWTSGATADVYLDTDRLTTNGLGTRVADGLAVSSGTNRFAYDGFGVPGGFYWVHVVVHHGATAVSAVSTGQVAVGLGPNNAPLLNAVAPSADQVALANFFAAVRAAQLARFYAAVRAAQLARYFAAVRAAQLARYFAAVRAAQLARFFAAVRAAQNHCTRLVTRQGRRVRITVPCPRP